MRDAAHRVACACIVAALSVSGCVPPPPSSPTASVRPPSATASGRATTAGRANTGRYIEQRTYMFTPTRELMRYAIYVSPRVDLTRPSPLVIVLHGLNNDPVRFLPLVANAVPNTTYILAAPMGYNVTGWYGANGANGVGAGRATGAPRNLGELSELDVMNVLALMRKNFNVDSNRIYIMGNSMGGAGAIHLGIKHKNIWAAVAARAPAIRAWIHKPDELNAAREMPMILVHGDADRSVPVAQSREWAAKMKELDMTHEYVELRGVGHGVDPDGVRAIFRFFDKHTKPAATAPAR